jgi:hypothetical protein
MCVGVVWSTFKFWRKLRKAQAAYVQAKTIEMKTGITEDQFIKNICRYDKEKYAPTVIQNKGNILFWAWHWPFSLIAFLCEDLLKEIWRMSWRMIKGLMESIRAASLGEAARDLDDKK